jgi:acyl-coenzyme A synthetase/AMP-(fatty) acid ligase
VEEAALAGGEAREAVAFGIADEAQGQAIVLILAGDPAHEPSLRARLKRDLPNFMQPSHIAWADALPRNANGKLDRAALRRDWAEKDRAS